MVSFIPSVFFFQFAPLSTERGDREGYEYPVSVVCQKFPEEAPSFEARELFVEVSLGFSPTALAMGSLPI